MQLKTKFCGVEKWHLDWLITSRSTVRVRPTATKTMFPLSYPGDGARLLTENEAGSSPAEGAKLREVNQTGSGLALKAMGTVSSRMEFDSTILPPKCDLDTKQIGRNTRHQVQSVRTCSK